VIRTTSAGLNQKPHKIQEDSTKKMAKRTRKGNTKKANAGRKKFESSRDTPGKLLVRGKKSGQEERQTNAGGDETRDNGRT